MNRTYEKMLYGKQDFDYLRCGYQIGEAVNSPMVSISRTISSNTVKVNLAAYVAELLQNKRISVLKGSNGTYIEVDNMNCYTEGFDIIISENYEKKRNDLLCITAIVINALLKPNKFPEFNTAVERMLNTGVSDKIDILMISDSFIYSVFNNIEFSCSISSIKDKIASLKFEYSKGIADMPDFCKKYGMPEVSIVKGIIKQNVVQKTIVKDTPDTFKERALNGEFLTNYEFNEEQKKMIPSLNYLETFKANKLFVKLVKKVLFRFNKVDERLLEGIGIVDAIGNDFINSTVNGRPASGKTKTLYAVGAALGLPVYTVTQSKRTEEDNYQGKNKVIQGKISFKETNFLKGFSTGGIVILEELNLADAAITMGTLGQAIEFPFILERDGYEEIRRNPHCVIFSTMNVGTYGTKPTSQALSSRHRQDYILDDPNKKEFIEILRLTYNDKKMCEKVYKVYTNILNYLLSDDINRQDIALSITLRCCQGALQNIEEGEDFTDAIIDTFIGKVSEFDAELAEDVKSSVISIISAII